MNLPLQINYKLSCFLGEIPVVAVSNTATNFNPTAAICHAPLLLLFKSQIDSQRKRATTVISPQFSVSPTIKSVSPLCGWWFLTEQADVLCVFIWLKSLFIEWMNGICCADRVTKGLHLIAYTRNQIRFQKSELLSWQDEILWSINHHFYINILEKTCHSYWQTECY